MKPETEKLYGTLLEHQDRSLRVSVEYDYATQERTVAVRVAKDRWKLRDDYIFERTSRESADSREMDEHICEAIAEVKDEIDNAMRANPRTTWDALEDMITEVDL